MRAREVFMLLLSFKFFGSGTPGGDHTNWAIIKEAPQSIDYKGQLVSESFTPEVKVIAKAASIWRIIDGSGDIIAKEGLDFFRKNILVVRKYATYTLS